MLYLYLYSKVLFQLQIWRAGNVFHLPPLPSHNNWEGKCRGCVSTESENEKKNGQKSIKRDWSAERWSERPREYNRGSMLLFLLCYSGTYPGPKFLLHLKKNTSNLVNVERRAIKTIGGFSSRKSSKVLLSSAQKRNGRAGIWQTPVKCWSWQRRWKND